ncbi:ATP-binding protein [Salegentibacter salegens]|uniref:histidine kinase n=1 Tax=Salegentibacter salegens TaxID=143223 RepID=A0A1M7MGC7_9FLAO|nr:ATP-binding protein [Salegentibacter salegens]PRX48111.1 PAS domain S-box-containing protein [Salegentibacter salegens]SHM89880.1 PAS domain S-box-containing protein [Salegentibacter salegens]
MNNAKIEENKEIKRLQTLLSYNILDTPYEKDFNELAQLIALICDVPVAFIAMIDDKRQWYKAKVGIDGSETPLEETFCQYTVMQDELLEISDALLDERVKNNPHVTSENGIRFYAGMPLKAENGYNIGTVCVVDGKPGKLNDRQKQALKLLASQAMHLIEARQKNKSLGKELNNILEKRIEDTQRKLELQENENKSLMQAIKNSSGVVEFKPDGTIISLNRNFEEISGYTEKELQGSHHNMFITPADYAANKLLWEALRKCEYKTGRVRRIHKDGSEFYLQASYNPIQDLDGNVVKVVKISQDITKEIEAEISLEKAKEMAESLNEQKDNFIANVSHEIRTPIHAVLGFTDLLLENEKDTHKTNYLKAVKIAGDSLLFIVNDILDLSKMDAGLLQIDKDVFDIRDAVNRVFSILHLKAHQKKIEFEPHIADDVPTLLVGDKNRLSQVLINLLGNAIKFTSEGSVRLLVSVSKETSGLTRLNFKVSDTGIGIPTDKLDTVFHRFLQADENTSQKYGGTGLGLNISRQLIEKQGGTIEVQSEPGNGTDFIFDIPFEKATEEKGMAAAATDDLQEKYSGKILICEDSELNQRLVKALLKGKGLEVDIASNGEIALSFLKENTYDLIFMDVQMPVKNGYETTKFLRNKLELKTPIVALTANFMATERQKCAEVGMDDYLAKPFQKKQLFEKVEKWLYGERFAKQTVFN